MKYETWQGEPAADRSLYIKISPSTTRWLRLMRVARQTNTDWRELVRMAIDYYLNYCEKLI